jgi:hypothetical protein
VKVRTLDLYAAKASTRWLMFSRTFPGGGKHVLALVAEGTDGRPRVDVDAFEVRSTSP